MVGKLPEVNIYRDKGLLGYLSIGGRTILTGGNPKKYWVVGKDTEGSARPAFPLLFLWACAWLCLSLPAVPTPFLPGLPRTEFP